MCLYVRSLRLKEGRMLQAMLRRGKNRTAMRRAQVILLSAQKTCAEEIAPQTYLQKEKKVSGKDREAGEELEVLDRRCQ